MSFYSNISDVYNELFPYQKHTYNFLEGYINSNSIILDLGCGTGTYLSELSKSVKEAYGIDMDSEMINNAEKNTNNAKFSVMNILEIDSIKKKFDLIYSIGNVISYLSIEDLLELSAKVKKLLSKNGIWIFQTVNWDKLSYTTNYDFPVKEIREKGIKFYRSYERMDEAKVFFKIKVERDNKLVYENIDILNSILSNKIIDIHASNNLILKEMFGDFINSNFNDESKASIYVFTH